RPHPRRRRPPTLLLRRQSHRRHSLLFHSVILRPPEHPPFPYTTLFRSPSNSRVLRYRLQLRHNLEILRLEINVGMRGLHRKTRRSEEHTSELQSRGHLVCRLLLENKNRHTTEMLRRPHHRRHSVVVDA